MVDVDAVLLDVGGVLLLPDPAVMLPPIVAAGGYAEVADVDRAHYLATAAMDATGGPDRWAYLRTFARACRVPDERVDEAVGGLAALPVDRVWTRVPPGVVASLWKLAAAGMALGVVSNATGTIAQMLVTARICQVGEGAGVPVAVVVDSHLVGVEKPDPRIFHLALDELGVPPGRAAHVGDTAFADVAGATAAGVHPLHLDPHGDCPDRAGHPHVRSLDEVHALVTAPA